MQLDLLIRKIEIKKKTTKQETAETGNNKKHMTMKNESVTEIQVEI